MLPEIARRFRRFADEAAEGSSPLYARLARAAAGDPEVLGLLLDARPEQRYPMLLLAAVHDELLRDAGGHPLAAHYPDLAGGAPPPVEDPWPVFAAFCRERADSLRATCAVRRTQTNETARCSALLPGLAMSARRTGGRDLALVECGASAGLNLNFDRYAYDYGGGLEAGLPGAAPLIRCSLDGGARRPPVALPNVFWRRGIDVDPLDPADPDDARWLRACVWPDQPERLARLNAALAVAGSFPVRVEAGDATERVGELIAAAPAEASVVVLHSAFFPYLTRREEERFRAALASAGRPVAHLELEASRDARERPGEPLRFDLRLDGELLGRAAPHGQALTWLGR